MQYDDSSEYIINALKGAGYDAYIVGGCVRDMLLGITPKDYDICTSALPQEVKQCFSGHNVIETGIAHGTVTLLFEGIPYEITTYRTDGVYSDNRRPDNVTFVKSLKEDLRRRDFTINAMAYSHTTGVVDYFDGKEHLSKGIISAVGDPDLRFSEDALRIMRGLRFASTYGFKIATATADSMLKNRHLLKNIATERIQVELTGIICGKNAEKILCDFSKIIEIIIPELSPCFGFDQRTPYHKYDVWRHTLKAVAAARQDKIIRYSLLFHDIGKPDSFTVDDAGIGHFYGHASISVAITERILNRLKFDAKTATTILTLVKHHDNLINADKKTVRRWINRLDYDGFKQLIYIKQADITAQGNNECETRLKNCAELLQIADQLLREGDCLSLSTLNINGTDLINIGYKQGRCIGKLLADILSKVMDEELKNDREQLVAYATARFTNQTIEQ